MKALAEVDPDELRSAYEAEVGRPTGSDHSGYLIWKVLEARKGNITVGEVQRGVTGGETRTVPVRMSVELLEAVDAAWRHEGYCGRVALIRQVLGERVKVAWEAGGRTRGRSGLGRPQGWLGTLDAVRSWWSTSSSPRRCLAA